MKLKESGKEMENQSRSSRHLPDKDPLPPVSVLLCLKLRDFIIITYFRPLARKGISDGTVQHKLGGGIYLDAAY